MAWRESSLKKKKKEIQCTRISSSVTQQAIWRHISLRRSPPKLSAVRCVLTCPTCLQQNQPWDSISIPASQQGGKQEVRRKGK